MWPGASAFVLVTIFPRVRLVGRDDPGARKVNVVREDGGGGAGGRVKRRSGRDGSGGGAGGRGRRQTEGGKEKGERGHDGAEENTPLY